MLKGTLPLLILALLKQGDAYGYGLVGQLHGVGLPHVVSGTVYPLIARLEHDRLIASYLQPSDAGPVRKYYRITASGRAYLDAETARWERLASVTSSVLHSRHSQELS